MEGTEKQKSKLAEFPFHPALIAVIPALHLYVTNPSLLTMDLIWRPMAFTLLGVLVFWILGFAIFRKLDRSAVFATTCIVGAFCFAYLTRPFKFDANPLLLVIAYTLIWLAIAGLAGWKLAVTQFLNIAAGIIFGFQLASCVISRVESLRISPTLMAKSSGTAEVKYKPDIFYIILDGYGRSDQLRTKIGYDNSQFISQLRELGFYVAEQSHSNYCQTELSIASSLNYDMISNLLQNVPREFEDRNPLDALITQNRLSTRLAEAGYKTFTITTGFTPIHFKGTNINSNPEPGSRDVQPGMSLLESALLDMTPFSAFDILSDSMFFRRKAGLDSAFASLDSLQGRAAQPRFVFAHILAPHPPFVIDSSGQFVRPKGGFGFYDGSDFFERGGNVNEYKNGYKNQAAYISNLTLKTLKTLLSHTDNPPIIIVQGDHGSKLGLKQNSLAGTDLDECFSNLNAYFVPPAIKKDLYPEITPVNSFRIILSDLFGDQLPKLPDSSWHSPFAKPYELTDVTSRLSPAPSATK